MTTKRPSDARLAVARYGLERATAREPDEESSNTGQPTMDQRSQIVEIAIQQAQRRGDFDGLPGAGKPLTGLNQVRDPDWWIRRKIEREGLRGLGPPALTLRAEDAGLEERLDAVASEAAVREVLEDFNRRVREARRQLLGGPPVVTPTRDVEAEVAAWVQRRDERRRLADEQRRHEVAESAARTWWQRWRARPRPDS